MRLLALLLVVGCVAPTEPKVCEPDREVQLIEAGDTLTVRYGICIDIIPRMLPTVNVVLSRR